MLLIQRLFWTLLVVSYVVVVVAAVPVAVADLNDRAVAVVGVTFCLENKR